MLFRSGELRTRIIRSFWYLVVGALIAYQFFQPVYDFMYKPLDQEIHRLNIARGKKESLRLVKTEKPPFDPLHMPAPHDPPTAQDLKDRDAMIAWIFTHPASTPMIGGAFKSFAGPFMVQLELSVIMGFILVTPLIIKEIALFILPALTPEERKPLGLLMPVSIFCLILGVVVAYLTLFYAMGWFLSYLDNFPQGSTLLQDPGEYVLFFIKMMAAFGFAFQLPVVLMAGAFVGMITSAGLIKHWRWGIVIAVLGGILTPSNDMISMALMSIPLLLLYFASIYLVKIVEHMKAKKHPKPV